MRRLVIRRARVIRPSITTQLSITVVIKPIVNDSTTVDMVARSRRANLGQQCARAVRMYELHSCTQIYLMYAPINYEHVHLPERGKL